jgi:hypothetical protein
MLDQDMLYQREVDTLPIPRLQKRNTGLDLEPVWERLSSPVLGVRAQHTLFVLANSLVRNNEDMFLRWGRGEYMCNHQPDPEGRCAGQPQSVRHLFQDCARVAGAWSWLYAYLSFMPPTALSEAYCLTLLYPKLGSRVVEVSVICLLGSYQEIIISEAVEKRRVVREEELRGQLRQRYVAYSQKRPLMLSHL